MSSDSTQVNGQVIRGVWIRICFASVSQRVLLCTSLLSDSTREKVQYWSSECIIIYLRIYPKELRLYHLEALLYSLRRSCIVVVKIGIISISTGRHVDNDCITRKQNTDLSGSYCSFSNVIRRFLCLRTKMPQLMWKFEFRQLANFQHLLALFCWDLVFGIWHVLSHG